jgi:hypothetical protein
MCHHKLSAVFVVVVCCCLFVGEHSPIGEVRWYNACGTCRDAECGLLLVWTKVQTWIPMAEIADALKNSKAWKASTGPHRESVPKSLLEV